MKRLVCWLMAAVAVAVFSRCQKSEPCKVPCRFGNCEASRCNCYDGYEGDSCHIKTIDRYTGKWNALDSCKTNIWGYTAVLTAKTITQINLENFGGFGSSFVVIGQVNRDSIQILPQTVQGITVEGRATVSAADSVVRKLQVYFTLADEWGNTDTCRCHWLRQE